MRRLLALSCALVCCACATAADADNIVFVRGDNVWVAAPDGTHQAQVTTGRRFASPSQADDGTIVAIDDANMLHRLTQAGVPRNEPFLTWLGLQGGSGFSGPYFPRVSPDGTKIAFGYFHTQGVDIVTGRRSAGSPTHGPTTPPTCTSSGSSGADGPTRRGPATA
jgi:hypothetical protein